MKPPKPANTRQQIAAITEELRQLYIAPDQSRCQLQVENLRRMRQDLVSLLAKEVAA